MALIENAPQLDELLSRLRTEPLLAMDTEAASFHRYRDRVYLLQTSSRSETAVVDPLAVGLAEFADLFADPAIEIVFHDADYDLRLLDREYGLRTTNIFDTRIAAQLLNEPGVGLAALLEKYLGVRLDKRFQRADWSTRPLSRGMLEYAAADTRHLPELRDILRRQLEERGRLSWAMEEFGLLEGTRYSPPDEEEPAYLRMKSAKALRGRSLAVLRELHAWREDVAQRADKATFRILNNDPMLAMARTPPTTLEELKAIPGISADQAERRGREILSAVQRGLELPDADLPHVPRAPRRAHDPAVEARLERLKTVRNRLAIELALAPGVLCPNGTLEGVARANPRGVEELAATTILRRWQLSAIGGELLEALKATDGPTSEGTPAPSPSPATT
ncbi:MAG: HRDC domain-containing protein [Gemmatimonadales bacterium]